MLATPDLSSLITTDGALGVDRLHRLNRNRVAMWAVQVGRHIGRNVDRQIALEVRRRRHHQRVGVAINPP